MEQASTRKRDAHLPEWERCLAPTGAPSGLRPTVFADELGEQFVSRKAAQYRKRHGLYLTPVGVADYMAKRLDGRAGCIRILDPAAGTGVLCCAAVEALVAKQDKPADVELVAYEVDEELIAPLHRALAHLDAWAGERGVALTIRIENTDFVAAHNGVLGSNDELFDSGRDATGFDIVIGNPPYFKISRTDPRALALAEVVHGQPNIYALFMAASVALLRQGGQFVFITPRSFASGPYFRKFRTMFFRMLQPTHIHVFDSRREAFRRDEVLQENIILAGIRKDDWRSQNQHLVVASSTGVDDIQTCRRRKVRLGAAIDLQSSHKVLRLPVRTEDDDAVRLVDSWPNSLRRLGLDISTGPVVPFRASKHICERGNVPETHVPLLWMNHVGPLCATWPLAGRKPEFIGQDAKRLLVPNKNYVLLRRFSAKEEARRLTAAPYLASALATPAVGLENHLNYIHRPNGQLSEDEAWGLAALYSSRLMDTYFRTVNGNTQVNATELRTMPLPAHSAIVALGRGVRTAARPEDAVDEHVPRLLTTS